VAQTFRRVGFALQVLVEVLQGLQLADASAPYGGFIVKLNHRRILDAMLAVAGVPPQKFR
jgi:histidyl-tRNA synthetase